MSESFLAITASGTVTLELAKYNTPMIVVYKTHLTRFIIKLLVKVKYASIINIYFNKLIIPEFLFEDFKCKNVLPVFDQLVKFKEKRNKQIKKLKIFSSQMLVNKKNPAKIIVDSLF